NDQYVPDNLGVVEGIVKDDSGFYWMSGHKGLVRYFDNKSVKVADQVLPDFFTYKLEKDKYGGIWVTSEEGLFFRGRDNKNFSHGLPLSINKPANVISIPDGSHLIVGRITDICLIDIDKFYNGASDYYRIYDKTDGYPGAESLDNGIMNGEDGKVWILTSENLVRFDPSMVKKNMNPPSVHFTGLYFETDSQTWDPVRKGDFYYGIPADIKLRRDQIKIRITFTGISTTNPEKVRYQYLLKGTDNKWSLPFERREVIFRNLQPGKYSFLLRSINADGFETQEPLILNFSIAKAFWETNLFIISILTLVIVVTVVVTRLLIRKTQIFNEEKQKLRSELLRLQMNSFLKEFDPHFTFNAISSVGSLIMKNDRKAAYLYLTRLSSLLRTSLRDSTSLLKPISEELEFVRNYCELQKLRFGDRFSYTIQVENEVNMSLEIPKMTIQTFVENALKHGLENLKEGGSLEIAITHSGDFHKIIVRDNGIGRSASKEISTSGTGYGIRTISRIFEITGESNNLQATLEIRDLGNEGHTSGTEVVIIIPDRYSFRIDELTVIRDDEVKYF
ncbi:MAG: histidine kinase, partial [Bacteroidetes bacterium]|nr:histidine kinase [Bacteroidota bacterium]